MWSLPNVTGGRRCPPRPASVRSLVVDKRRWSRDRPGRADRAAPPHRRRTLSAHGAKLSARVTDPRPSGKRPPHDGSSRHPDVSAATTGGAMTVPDGGTG